MSPRDELVQRAVQWFAQNGVGDTSLRTLAANIGTSHRMLNYHFGSRQGLLAAVVESVEREEAAALSRAIDESASSPAFASSDSSAVDIGDVLWRRLADRAQIFAPLFFELSSSAMRDLPEARALREWLLTGWTSALREGFRRRGMRRPAAESLALQCVAMARGLLFELAIRGDRAAVDRAYRDWTRSLIARL